MMIESVKYETLVPSPARGVGVMGAIYYTRASGIEMLCSYGIQTRGDLCDRSFTMFSSDNGQTWSEPEVSKTEIEKSDGILRRRPMVAVLDKQKDRFIWFFNEGFFDGEDPLQGMLRYQLRYRVSSDGGHTWDTDELMIQEGEEFDKNHPFPDVWVGHNSMMIGDQSCVPLIDSEGNLWVPAQMCPLGPDKIYYNPGGGYTYHHTVIISGSWKDDSTIDWRLSGVVKGDPKRSTRGLLEPTIGKLDDGRMLMVMRGSNDVKPNLLGYRWVSIFDKHKEIWSMPLPWTYTDGEQFHSPSSCSQLLHHSSGRLLWIGNLCRENPQGNRPRYPLIIAEVDTKTGLLIRNSIKILDDRSPSESERLTLSNFHVLEDRKSHEILITLPRYFAQVPMDNVADFSANLTLIKVKLK